jgi:hypothetical protein
MMLLSQLYISAVVTECNSVYPEQRRGARVQSIFNRELIHRRKIINSKFSFDPKILKSNFVNCVAI